MKGAAEKVARDEAELAGGQGPQSPLSEPLPHPSTQAQADFGYAMAKVYTNIKQYFFIFN